MISKMRIHPDTLVSLARLSKVLATLLVAVIAASFSSGLYAADMFKGRQLYTSNCAICHGQTGRAVMPNATDFTRQENMMKPDMVLLGSIRSGRNAMPAFQGILSDRDIMDVIAYIRTLN